MIQEHEEAVRIAQAYKAELDRIVICDDDINRLYATASKLLDIIKGEAVIITNEKVDYLPVTQIKNFRKYCCKFLQKMQLIMGNIKCGILEAGFRHKEGRGLH